MVRERKQGKLCLIGIARRSRSALMVSTALQAAAVIILACPSEAQPAPNAQPAGGVVVGGAVTISQTASATMINQATQRGAVNWQSFNVGSKQSVTFQQPNTQAITLNTVIGPNPSQIAGRISANGQVVLVNQSGVTFYKGSQVNAAGLMVSAAGTDTNTFMGGGRIVFNQPGSPNARIVNNGNITIKDAGLAGLVAPSVANAGVINAQLGHVVLAGARISTVDLYGDKLTAIDVTGAVTQAPGGGEALVTNTGVIRADGGAVRLTARAVDGVISNLVSAGGKVEARTVGSRQGQITIDAVGGSITLEGYLTATGKAPGTTGGKIGVLATDAVIVKSGAVVNASGAAGGGTIAIGTTLKRAAAGPALTHAKTAKSVLIQQGAMIEANATVNGNGGRVTVLSSEQTTMQGTISATGGPIGGNGGFAEVSGGALSLTGAVNLVAPSGLAGSLLLDPTDLNIVDTSAAGTNIDGEFVLVANNGTLAFTAANAVTIPSSITATEIKTLGANGNVTIEASGSIDFQNVQIPISIAHDLTVQAGSDLLIDRGVSISTASNLSLTSGANTVTGVAMNTGSIALGTTGTGAAASLSANALVMNAGATGIHLNDGVVNVTGLANLNAVGGGISQAGFGVFTAATLQSTAGITGTVSLAGTLNAVGTLAAVAVTNGDMALFNGSPLEVAGLINAGNGNIFVAVGANKLTIDPNSGFVSRSGGRIGIQSDTITGIGVSGAQGTVNAGTTGLVELAPSTTTVAVTLGAAAGLSLTDTTGIMAGTLRIGAVTLPGAAVPVTTARSIAVTGTFGSTALALDLNASGAVTQTAALSAKALTGKAASYTLINVGNNILQIGGTAATFTTLTATGGTIAVVDSAAVTVAGTVNAVAGNVFLEDTLPSNMTTNIGTNTVTFLSTGGTILSQAGGVIGIEADRIANLGSGGVINAGTAGTVELAPFSTGTVANSMITIGTSASSGLWLASLVGIDAGTLRYGAVTLPEGTVATTTANGITITGTGSFDATAIVTLDLEANGAIGQNAIVPIVNLGTLIASTNNVTGSISLASTLNAIAGIGDISVAGGDFTFADTVPALATVLAGQTVFANNVSMTVNGALTVLGTVLAQAPSGTLALTTTGGASLNVDSTATPSNPLIGAGGLATLTAGGDLSQFGGLVNGGTVSVAATGNIVQSGTATIASLGSANGLTVTANTGSLTQSGPAPSLWSNGTLAIAAPGGITLTGSNISVGDGTLAAVNGAISIGGILASGGSMSASGGSLTQTGGTIAAMGAFTVNVATSASQTGGVVAAGGLSVTAGTSSSFGSTTGATKVTQTSAIVSGVDGKGTISPLPPAVTAPSVGALGFGSGSGGPNPSFPYLIMINAPTITVPAGGMTASLVELNAGTVGLVGTTSTVLSASSTIMQIGTITADLLTGAAGSATLTNSGNVINNLGTFAVNTAFALMDGGSLDVIGTARAILPGGTVSLQTAPGRVLTVDQLGSNYVIGSGLGLTAGQTIQTAGSLFAQSSTGVGTVVPGQIVLRTDALVTNGTAAATLINASDGLVAIAPSSTIGTASTISLGGGVGLSLPQTTLSTIKTVGTASGGTDGTETLLLGAQGLNGPVTASAIVINTGTFVTGGAPSIARDLVLAASGAVTQAGTSDLTVIALAGTAASFQLSGANAINEIGNAAARTIGGTVFATASTLTGTTLTEGLMATSGTILVNDTASATQTLSVVGTVNAAGGPGTIALFAPAIQIINGSAAVLASGTITGAGSLVAGASTISTQNTITPALIQLQADQLSIDLIGGGPGTLISAPGGLVAITPWTSGHAVSVIAGSAASPILPATTLTLGATDLSRISTMGAVSGLTASGPLGTRTLSLGRAYVSNTGTLMPAATVNASGGTVISVTDTAITAGSIAIGATLDLTGVASTAALYAIGTITEQPSGVTPTGALIVNTLVGTSTTGSLYLNGANFVSHIGNVASQAGLTSSASITSTLGTIGNLIAPAGNVLVTNGTDVAVAAGTTIEGGPITGTIGAGGILTGGNYAEIDVVASGSATTGNLAIDGTVLAADVFLRAGNGTVAGNVTLVGSVVARDEADLSAGVAYSPATPVSSPVPGFAGAGTGGGTIQISGGINAGIVGLFATNDIGESGGIGAGLLYGYAGGNASLPGSNAVGDLGPFITGAGFAMRNAEALLVVGQVSAITGDVTIGVAPPGAARDLMIANIVSATAGTVDLGATGNVFEAQYTATPVVTWNGTGMSRVPTGTTVVTQGTVFANTLVSEAGVLPDTETVHNTPGTIPTTTKSLAIDWFGSPNHVVNLGGITSTGDFLLYNAQGLTVTGNVYAGAAVGNLTPAVPSATVIAGEFGTTPAAVPAPFAEIDVLSASNGNLTIADGAIVHAGLDGSLTGNVTLRAGSDATAGLIDVGTSLGSAAGVFAANGGAVSLSAGFNPSPIAAASPYLTTSGSVASGITIYGTIWGDAPGGTTIAPASTVTLDAASSIDELGSAAVIGAGTLIGHAGYHANIGEVVAQSASAYATGIVTSGNRIANLGSFQSDTFNDDPLGFLLRDGQTLAVAGVVTDFGADASKGISIAIASGAGTAYAAGDLLLQNTLSVQASNTLAAISLQATGNIRQTGGMIVANTLVVQAGAIPDTELSGNTPGMEPTAGQIVSPSAVAVLTANNSISSLGSPNRGVTTTGDFSLTNGPNLTVPGTVVSTSGNVTVINSGFVINNGLILSRRKNASITSTASFINNPGMVKAEIDTFLNAAGSIANNGLIEAVANNTSLIAGTSISNNGTAIAGNTAMLSTGLTAPAQIANGIDVAGLVNAPTVIATAAGTIVETGTLIATLLTGSAGGSVSLTGAGNPTANRVAILGTFDSNLTFSLSPGFLLRDGQALTVAGPVTDHATSNASGVTLTVAQPGSFNGYGAVSLTLSGPVSANARTGTVRLEATGDVIQTPGIAGNIITAGTLVTQAGHIPDTEPTGHPPGAALASLPGSGSSVSLPNANLIMSLASASAAGNLTLTDVTNLTITGPITVGGVFALTDTGNLTIGGASSIGASAATVVDNGSATIAGAITSSGTAALTVAGTLGISGTLAAGTAITITDEDAITFGGLLSAPGIVVNNGTSGQFAVTPGARIQTTGVARPRGALSLSQLARLTPSLAGGNGFYLRTGQFTESGALTVTGPMPQIRIDASAGIQFGSSGGLVAPSSWLVLELLGGGKATGAIDVGALDLYFSGQNTGASLSGLIGGLNGNAAAGAAHIVPATSTAFQVNGCPIASINCVLITTQPVPPPRPLADLDIGYDTDPTDKDDLTLPLVSDQRY
jgi:filamentous hemagglutinin family protein